MTIEANKQLVRRAIDEVFNAGDLSAVDVVYGPGYAEHEHAFAGLIRGAFPDLRLEVEHLVAENDLVCTRWRAYGTHAGAFLGIEPTGRHASWTGTWIQRVADGRIVEGQDWGNWDATGLVAQLSGTAAR